MQEAALLLGGASAAGPPPYFEGQGSNQWYPTELIVITKMFGTCVV